jgi:hypothetical protein
MASYDVASNIYQALLVGPQRAAAAAARAALVGEALAALAAVRMSGEAWQRAGVAGAPAAKHGRPQSAAALLVNHGIMPLDVVGRRRLTVSNPR